MAPDVAAISDVHPRRPGRTEALEEVLAGPYRPRFCQLRNAPQSAPCASGRMAAGACPLADCYRSHLTAREPQNY